MHPLIQLKRVTRIFLVALACFGLSTRAEAVTPPPDGGYPEFTTAEGTNALKSLTTGSVNTGLGWSSLLNLTTGNYNTGVGGGTLALNNGDFNTAVGAAALLLSTTAANNVAVGTGALLFNDTGTENTAVGAFALQNNTSETNTAVGAFALVNDTTGGANVAIGVPAMHSNTSGSNNVAIGNSTLFANTTGFDNTAIGIGALPASTGNFNVALGASAGLNHVTGSNNIYIGDGGLPSESNVIAIGNVSSSGTAYEQFFVGAVYGVTTGSATTLPVIVSNNGQLGTTPSAARFKKEIKPMNNTSESVLALEPVTFQYKSDKTNTPQFGLVAEEVAKVNPDLVVRDRNGEIYSVRYDAVNAMLLNEFLKEHRKVQELESIVAKREASAAKQEAAITLQQKQIETLTAGLQKVSAQLELSKPAPRVVNKNQ